MVAVVKAGARSDLKLSRREWSCNIARLICITFRTGRELQPDNEKHFINFHPN
jgi:hypothetical protein